MGKKGGRITEERNGQIGEERRLQCFCCRCCWVTSRWQAGSDPYVCLVTGEMEPTASSSSCDCIRQKNSRHVEGLVGWSGGRGQYICVRVCVWRWADKGQWWIMGTGQMLSSLVDCNQFPFTRLSPLRHSNGQRRLRHPRSPDDALRQVPTCRAQHHHPPPPPSFTAMAQSALAHSVCWAPSPNIPENKLKCSSLGRPGRWLTLLKVWWLNTLEQADLHYHYCCIYCILSHSHPTSSFTPYHDNIKSHGFKSTEIFHHELFFLWERESAGHVANTPAEKKTWKAGALCSDSKHYGLNVDSMCSLSLIWLTGDMVCKRVSFLLRLLQ